MHKPLKVALVVVGASVLLVGGFLGYGKYVDKQQKQQLATAVRELAIPHSCTKRDQTYDPGNYTYLSGTVPSWTIAYNCDGTSSHQELHAEIISQLQKQDYQLISDNASDVEDDPLLTPINYSFMYASNEATIAYTFDGGVESVRQADRSQLDQKPVTSIVVEAN